MSRAGSCYRKTQHSLRHSLTEAVTTCVCGRECPYFRMFSNDIPWWQSWLTTTTTNNELITPQTRPLPWGPRTQPASRQRGLYFEHSCGLRPSSSSSWLAVLLQQPPSILTWRRCSVYQVNNTFVSGMRPFNVDPCHALAQFFLIEITRFVCRVNIEGAALHHRYAFNQSLRFLSS